MKRTIAFVRADLLEDEDYPNASICVTREDWESLGFYCMQLDKEDNQPFLETDTEDGYNMILLHPKTKELFWAYSADFEFKQGY